MHTQSDYKMVTQLPIPMLFGAAITVALVLAMQALIDANVELVDDPVRVRVDPVMARPDPPEILPPQREQRSEDPALEPQRLQQEFPLEPMEGTLAINHEVKPKIADPDIGAGSGTSTIVPIFRVAPDYPVSASRRGIEGYVDLLFDVSATGKTENIRILASSPEGVFDQAALRALRKWKYKPPMDEGIAYRQDNMTTRIRFALEH